MYTLIATTTRFEYAYMQLVEYVLAHGKSNPCRNGSALSVFPVAITLTDTHLNPVPLLLGRRMYPEGIIGELAAFLKGPKSLADFEKQGCNYWKLWAKDDGSINVDYGNLWLDFNGVNQLDTVVDSLKEDPHGRRHLISGWDPSNLANLDLPCCHYAYEWYVRDGHLDMMWHQRSADLMIGVPSDIVLAVLWNSLMANTVGLIPGNVTLILGNTHIYSEHIENASVYTAREDVLSECSEMTAILSPTATVYNFTPDAVQYQYSPLSPILFELKS